MNTIALIEPKDPPFLSVQTKRMLKAFPDTDGKPTITPEDAKRLLKCLDKTRFGYATLTLFCPTVTITNFLRTKKGRWMYFYGATKQDREYIRECWGHIAFSGTRRAAVEFLTKIVDS